MGTMTGEGGKNISDGLSNRQGVGRRKKKLKWCLPHGGKRETEEGSKNANLEKGGPTTTGLPPPARL